MHNTPHTPETKAKISAAKKGVTHSEETRLKISEIMKGKKYKPRAVGSRAGSKWYNNGEKNCRSKEHPGEGWVPGMITDRIIEVGPQYRRGFLRSALEAWAGRNKNKTPFCEWCYSEDNLQAHHILPKSKFPQYAYDDDNCRIMCNACHTTCHKQGGY